MSTKHRCCFTGHRPEKLNMDENTAKELLRKEIRNAISDGFYVFITGMARGIDMWAAEIVIEEREHNPDLKLVCASPYHGFERRWSYKEQERYNNILSESDLTEYICDRFSMDSFQKRNIWMVNHSGRVIAAYNGESGGTRNTIVYAQEKGVQVINIFENS